jgi:hypothetical protein
MFLQNICKCPPEYNLSYSRNETFVHSIFYSLFDEWAFGEVVQYDDTEHVGLEVTL